MDATLDALLRRADRPANWMPAPETWVWNVPGADGIMQGFGPCWQSDPGLANLLWLALDMKAPPRIYDARNNEMYRTLVVMAPTKLHKLCLLAEALSLGDFHNRLGAAEGYAACAGSEWMRTGLRRLAEGRLVNANS